MANIVPNIAKGRVIEFYNRVKNNDLPVGLASQSSTSFALIASKSRTASLANDTAMSLALSGRKTRAVALSGETNIAYALDYVGGEPGESGAARGLLSGGRWAGGRRGLY